MVTATNEGNEGTAATAANVGKEAEVASTARPTAVPRIAFLAPMEMELEPLVAQLMLRSRSDGTWTGSFDDVELVAQASDIGMDAAGHATERVLGLGASVVAVVGIAGGVDPDTVAIGEVIRPVAVQHRAAGTEHLPTATDEGARHGVLSCGDELITDPAALAVLGRAGVIALDMETAAVATVCDARGVPWSAFRAISDHAGAGLVGHDVIAVTTPDGRADPDALRAFVAADPDGRARLERLAADAVRAADAAAAAAVDALGALARIARTRAGQPG